MLVNKSLEQSVLKFPDKVALIFQDERINFSSLNDQSNRLANALIDNGLQKGERSAIFLDNSVESIISIFAALKAGAVFVVMNPQIKARKAKYILNDCQVKVLMTDVAHLKEIAPVLSNCQELEVIIIKDYELMDKDTPGNIPQNLHSYSKIMEEYASDQPPRRCIDIDLASLIYTSGSTGIPKGVMCTHLNMVSASNSIIEYLENTHEDIILNVLPLSFDYGLYQILMAFKFGGTVVLEKSFLYPYTIIDLIMREKVTGFPIVPTMSALLLRLKNLDKNDFSSLRYITSTGHSLPLKHINHLCRLFPTAKIYSMYGLTECKRVSCLPPEEIEKRPDSVGKAIPNTEVYLIDERGDKVDSAGQIGELVVRGANVMRGYWNLTDETEKFFKPGPIPGEQILYTGDLFKMDEEGFLYFISRKDDLIKVKAERVSPKEVEDVLYEMEDINEAKVIGVEDDILGHAVKAFVSLRKGSNLTKQDIILYCSQNLENFMVPKYLEILEEFPKSHHGKIATNELK